MQLPHPPTQPTQPTNQPTHQPTHQARLIKNNCTFFFFSFLQALLVEFLPDFLPTGRYSNSFYVFNALANLLAAISSSINFFFFCALGSKYRATLQSLCCRGGNNKTLKSIRYSRDSRPVTVVAIVELGNMNGSKSPPLLH